MAVADLDSVAEMIYLARSVVPASHKYLREVTTSHSTTQTAIPKNMNAVITITEVVSKMTRNLPIARA